MVARPRSFRSWYSWYIVPTMKHLLKHPGKVANNQLTKRRGHLGFCTCTELVSRCKLYGTHLIVEAELYGIYLAYHTGKVRQVSRSVVCTRPKKQKQPAAPVTAPTYDYIVIHGRTRVTKVNLGLKWPK